jgi:hypothetical protein
MRVDLNPEAVDPQQIQIVLLNLEAVEARRSSLQHETSRRIAQAGIVQLESE